jgi:hypothetical protein
MATSTQADGAAQRLVDLLPDPVQTPLTKCRIGEWRFLESNRRLYKEIHSRQDKPPWSLIEGVLSSSIN